MQPIEPQVALQMQLWVARRTLAASSNYQPMVEEFNAGNTLRALIERSGKLQTELADHMGVSVQAVQKWVKTGGFSRDQIRKLCIFLDCSADELLGLAPIGDKKISLLSQSQDLAIDTDILQSSIVAVKEAVKANRKGMDVFEAAPLIALAYLERMEYPKKMSKQEYAAFDLMLQVKLRGEIENGQGTEEGATTDRGKKSNEETEATKRRSWSR